MDLIGGKLGVEIPHTVADFQLTDEIRWQVEASMERFQSAASSVDIRYYHYTKYGSELIKTNNLSPDSLTQLSFQVPIKFNYFYLYTY